MKDLTIGRPGRVLLGYTLPLFGSIIFQQLYNIADSFVAGQYIGTAALAAVGNSYEITLIYIALAFGCNVGASVVSARFFGQKDYDNVRTCVNTSLIFAAMLGVALTAVGVFAADWLLRAINTPLELMQDSKDYLDIYILSYVFVILYQVSTGLFSALGDSQTPFWFLAASSVINIFVDIIFVRDLHLGVKGVAYATFLCQSISGILAVVVLLRKVGRLGGRGKLFDGRMLGKILRIAAPSAVQQSCISIGNILIQSVINGFGTAATGGYAAAVKLNNMTITSITALGSGISNYASQNLGAGKYQRIRQGTRSGIMLGIGFALAFTLLYQLFCQPLLGLFITGGTTPEEAAISAEAMRIGTLFLRIVTPFYAVIAIKLITDGILRGVSLMTQFMFSTMTDLVLRVVLAYVLSTRFGIAGVWCAWPIGWVLGVAMSFLFYFLWQKNQPQND